MFNEGAEISSMINLIIGEVIQSLAEWYAHPGNVLYTWSEYVKAKEY